MYIILLLSLTNDYKRPLSIFLNLGFYSSLPPPPSINSSLPAPSSNSTSQTLLESSTSKSLSISSGFNSSPPSSAYVNNGSNGNGKNVNNSGRQGPPLVIGSFNHDLPVVPWKSHAFPGIDFLSCYVRKILFSIKN